MRNRTIAVLVLLLSLSERPAIASWEDAEECYQAKEDAQYAAQELTSAAQSLGYCAEAEDFDDDCSSEFYQAQTAHGDYESAVSDISSYCN